MLQFPNAHNSQYTKLRVNKTSNGLFNDTAAATDLIYISLVCKLFLIPMSCSL